jgi:type 1 glutamine amidotransferase
MVKKNWAITLVVVLILLAALATLASLVYKNATTIPQISCNGQQASFTILASSTTGACQRRLLVFSKTTGFRHASIKDGKIALQKLASEHNFAIDFTEDATVFTDANLARYAAVVFLLTTGEIFDNNQQAAFERYIRGGGGYVGVHSASDTEYDWPWYGGLLGSFIDRIHKHSRVLKATLHVTDRAHQSTNMLPPLWIRTDEWYNFASNPREKVHILLTIDESTYEGGTMGVDHPIAWYHAYDGGRAWYTAMGHTSESYYEPLFLAHLWGGITYAVGTGRKQAFISPQIPHMLLQQAIEIVLIADVSTRRWAPCLPFPLL